jgi:hypothetical protein
VIATVGADEAATLAALQFLLHDLGWVFIVAAGAFDGLEVGHLAFEPVGDDLGEDPPAPAEGTDGVVSLEDGVADESGFVGETVENLGQMLINAE